MTASQAKNPSNLAFRQVLARFLVGFALVCAPFAWAPSIWAQDAGAPVQLPPAGDEEEPEDEEAAPARIGTMRVAPRVGSQDLSIEVGVIGGNATPVGTLVGSQSLGGDLWQGTSATTALVLLNQIPTQAPSRAMSGLLRRLLLSPSRPPRDPRGGDPIVGLRITKAWEAGFIDAIPAMVEQAGALVNDEEIQMLGARAILLSGNDAEICSDATARRLESEEPFWMKLRALCFQRQGLIPAARLTSDLLYDSGDEDELFQVLLERLSGNDRVDVQAEFGVPISEIHFAMLRDVGVAPPASGLGTMSLPMARAFALNATWDDIDDRRLASGERAAAVSAISSAELLQVYQNSSSYDPDRRAELLNGAANRNTATSRALFAEAVLVDSSPEAKAQDVSAAIRARGAMDGELAYLAALGRAARVMKPDPALARSAYDFAVVALADGNLAEAYDWYDVMASDGMASPAQIQSMRVALIVARPNNRFAYWPEQALRWIEQADLGEFSYRRVTTQLILLEALGYEIPEEVNMRMALHQEDLEGAMPNPGLVENLREAAADGRIGETVAISLVMIGTGASAEDDVAIAGSVAETHPLVLAEVMRALNAIGLEVDARALATEMLLSFAVEEVE